MASILLGDLNDYIEPSQACVNPLFVSQSSSKTSSFSKTSSSSNTTSNDKETFAKISLDSGIFSGISTETNLIRQEGATSNHATVSLDDCLACSGCVTSAETVLITQQSTKEFLSNLRERKYKLYVVSISPQSRSSLAAHFNLDPLSTYCKLITLFKGLGVHLVVDTSSASDIALLEARTEFIQRYRYQQQQQHTGTTTSGNGNINGNSNINGNINGIDGNGNSNSNGGGFVTNSLWQTPVKSVAVSSTTVYYPDEDRTTHYSHPLLSNALPMLTSACPGWVCYAEKTQPNAIPYMSTAKSPQQIMGSLLKHQLSKYCCQPHEIYHTTVMPCYDKKLEASRKDFLDSFHPSQPSHNQELGVRQVDCVLSTGEILELLESEQIDFLSLAEASLAKNALSEEERILTNVTEDGKHFLGATNGETGSGGFLEHIFRYAAQELFGVHLQGDLTYVISKNNDFKEVSLEINGVKVLNFALAYGFRNIQRVIGQLRRRKCTYHFVEVMACPSGCLNGGGQIKYPTIEQAKFQLAQSEMLFKDRHLRDPQHNPIYQNWIKAQPLSDISLQMFHTRYHAIPQLETMNPLGIKW